MGTNSQLSFPLESDTSDSIAVKPRREWIGKTDVVLVIAREILTRATGFMDAYDFTLNPYSGCSFGCTYCYAAFFSRDVERRDNWGYWVDVKENAVELTAKRKAGSLDDKLIYMSSVTDPYQPVERELKLTRGILEIMAERHKPKLVVQTRSPTVVRDCDLFRQIEKNGGRVQVKHDRHHRRRGHSPHLRAVLPVEHGATAGDWRGAGGRGLTRA